MIYQANLTCPFCGYVQQVEMPAEACQYYYECVNCKRVMKAKKGDCCVFCSYSDQLCPPKQKEKGRS